MSVADAIRPEPVVDAVPTAEAVPTAGVGVPDLPPLGDLPPLLTRLVAAAQLPVLQVIRRAWRVEIHGADHVPVDGPVILAGNHIGVLDGPLIVAASPRRLTFALAKRELFVGVLGRLLRRCGQIPVDRRRVDKGAIRRCLQVLTHGHTLAIFPEGIRGAGEVEHAHRGVGYLAMLTGAPVVPVAMLGTRDAGRSTKSLPTRGRAVHVVFGPPIPTSPQPWPRRAGEVALRTEEIRGLLAEHVLRAQQLTGVELPGPAPAIVPGRRAGRRAVIGR